MHNPTPDSVTGMTMASRSARSLGACSWDALPGGCRGLREKPHTGAEAVPARGTTGQAANDASAAVPRGHVQSRARWVSMIHSRLQTPCMPPPSFPSEAAYSVCVGRFVAPLCADSPRRRRAAAGPGRWSPGSAHPGTLTETRTALPVPGCRGTLSCSCRALRPRREDAPMPVRTRPAGPRFSDSEDSPEAGVFRGSITRLRHPPPTLPASVTLYGQGWLPAAWHALPGGVRRQRLHPLGSYHEFQSQVPCLSPPFMPALAWRDDTDPDPDGGGIRLHD
jgi:hypothetical protein